MRLTGRIVFGDDAETFTGGTAYLTIEDTTAADAHAVALGSWRRDQVSYPADAAGIPFEITASDPPPGHRVTLRVLVDADGDGRLGVGDYLNVESVPASPGGAVTVRVKRYQ